MRNLTSAIVKKYVPAGLLIITVTAVVFSPLFSLFLADSSLGKHAYQEMLFQVIANNALPGKLSDREIVRKAVYYTRSNIFTLSDSVPYSAKHFEYLIEGIGWCDYLSQVLCRILAAKGISARYIFLMDENNISPHTVAEVCIKGKWVGVDPLFNIIYSDTRGNLFGISEITPHIIPGLSDMLIIKNNRQELYEAITEAYLRTYPLKNPPKISDDFLKEKHILDIIMKLYVNILGERFTDVYQDIYIANTLYKKKTEAEKLWYRARNYDLFGRIDKALPLYTRIIADYPESTYHQRAYIFLSLLLMQKNRFQEAKELLYEFAKIYPDSRWRNDQPFYLARCCEELQDMPNAVKYYTMAKEGRFILEAVQRLNEISH